MKLPALVLLAAFAAGMAGCCRRAAAPQFAERSLDTVVRCGAVPCDLSYRFLTIANADRSEALAAIENANVNYFFALEDFTGTAEEAARRFIERFAADNACDTLYMPNMRYSLSVAAAQAPVDTLTVYTIRRESYTGGAHGMRTTSTTTIGRRAVTNSRSATSFRRSSFPGSPSGSRRSSASPVRCRR